MKKIFFVMFAFFILSSVAFSQPEVMSFKAFELNVLNAQTGKVLETGPITAILILDDEGLSMPETGLKWSFTGKMVETSDDQFYVDAKDQDNIKCRIWFQRAVDETTIIFGIEYSDIGLVYRAKYNN